MLEADRESYGNRDEELSEKSTWQRFFLSSKATAILTRIGNRIRQQVDVIVDPEGSQLRNLRRLRGRYDSKF